jgi:hypothetical protein
MTAEEVHVGYELESGLLTRVRQWTDVFGSLRLIRVLRISVSPVSLFVVAAVYLVWLIGFATFLPPRGHWQMSASGNEAANVVDSVSLVILSSNPTSLWLAANGTDAWSSVWLVVWSLVLWTPAALFLARQGGLLTADRSLESSGELLRRTFLRTPSAWLAATLPTICAAAIGIGVVVLFLLMRMVAGITWFEFPLAILITVVAIPIGLLLFGSFVAMPLAIASIANEQDADPMDSLSRGYESLYRRPLHLLVSTLTAAVLVAVVWGIGSGVCGLASAAVQTLGKIVGVDPNGQALVQSIIAEIPTILTLTTWLAMMGGIYLLARQSTGGQEVEDLWICERPSPPPMPRPEG